MCELWLEKTSPSCARSETFARVMVIMLSLADHLVLHLAMGMLELVAYLEPRDFAEFCGRKIGFARNCCTVAIQSYSSWYMY